MKKGILSNIWYVLLKTWQYEKKVIIIIALQIVIGVIIPFASVVLPSLVVNGISDEMDYTIIIYIVITVILLLISNVTMTYISKIYETYLLNNKIGFLSALFRKKMKIEYAYIESTDGQNKYQNAFMSVLNDTQGISGMLSLIGPIIGNIIGLFVNVILIIKFNVWIVAVLTLTAIVHLYIVSKIREKQSKLREAIVVSSRKLSYLLKYISEENNAREIRIFDMYKWMINIINKEIKVRIDIANKSARYNFFLVNVDSIMLAFRDIFVYFITFRAVYLGRIEVWELVQHCGINGE